VQPTIVVKVKVSVQTVYQMPHIPILAEVNLLVFNGSPESFQEDVVKNHTPAIHINSYTRLLQPSSGYT